MGVILWSEKIPNEVQPPNLAITMREGFCLEFKLDVLLMPQELEVR